MTQSPESTSSPRNRSRRRNLRGVLAMGGLVVGALVAEQAFVLRDDGAFPHLNVYVEDADLGVRLEPGRTQRLRFQDNPTSSITIGPDGYRVVPGAATGRGIALIGDSQVFGLGVDDDETIAAHLARASGRPVRNLGVPTYGPVEFEAVAREAIAGGQTDTIVLVVNIANDLFETDRPNRERHAVQDGWAVRIETAQSTPWFPGRGWLMNRSHAMFALRQVWHRMLGAPTGVALPSEGSWQDLVQSAESIAVEHANAAEAVAREQRQRDEALAVDLERREETLDEALIQHASHDWSRDEDAPWVLVSLVRRAGGDIVSVGGEEESRPVRVTAAYLRRATAWRAALLARARRDPRVVQAEAGVLDADARRREALADPAEPVHVPSVLEPRLRTLRDLCHAAGLRLVVVALPLDVMVSPAEWAKYGVAEPPPIEEARVLLTDLVISAQRLGVRAFDASTALAAAPEPRWLRGDLHMTTNGHRSVAEAIHAILATPPPIAAPSLVLPPGRTPVPEPDEFRGVEATVHGSTAAGCATHMVREWLRVACRRGSRRTPLRVEVIEGNAGETFALSFPDGVSFLAPRPAAGELRARFVFAERSWILVLPVEGDPRLERESDARVTPPAEHDVADLETIEDALCHCHFVVHDSRFGCEGEALESYCPETCVGHVGTADASCVEGSPSDLRHHSSWEELRDRCRRMLACSRGRLDAVAACPEGQVRAFATHRCFVPCSDEVPCTEGRCTPTGGSAVCVP